MGFRNSFWSWFHQFSVARPRRTPFALNPGDPVVIAGMFRTASGLGVWARSNYRILRAAGFDVTAVDLSEALSCVDLDTDIPLDTLPATRTGTLILHVNGPETAFSLRQIGLRRGRHWRVIGAWAWELEVFPPGWDKAFMYLSEIWALSDFAASAFCQHAQTPPVRTLPISVSVPCNLQISRVEKAHTFTVLVMADAMSTLTRKNPLGAVQAYLQAFGDRQDCRLVLKVRNLDGSNNEHQALLNEISGRENIQLVQEALAEEDQYALIAHSDVLLSLHRAEGFGLGPAEAMMLGVPVVATNWSGNLMFMTQETAMLVPYQYVPVPEGCIHYGVEGAEWAEPDIFAAADALRKLEADRDFARDLSNRARMHLNQVCGEPTIKALAVRYLKEPPIPVSR